MGRVTRSNDLTAKILQEAGLEWGWDARFPLEAKEWLEFNNLNPKIEGDEYIVSVLTKEKAEEFVKAWQINHIFDFTTDSNAKI